MAAAEPVSLSVVIPTLNEAAALPSLLSQLRAQQGVQLHIIVADGGSGDRTLELADGATPVRALRGRGAQMNAGARAARHELLLFLHADSQLPDPRLLADAVRAFADSPPRSAGHFALRFVRSESGHERFFRYLEEKTRLNRAGTINGDQGLLIRRAYFEELGGFDESLPILEDTRISAKISASGEWRLLPGLLHTSARRFEQEGHAARYTLMALMMGLHAAGADEFFERAPAVYRAHSSERGISLRPFLALARQVLRERGRWRTLRTIGSYVRANAWQLALARDIRRDDGELRSLQYFDRRLAARLDHPFFDILGALLAAAWLYIYLPLRVKS